MEREREVCSQLHWLSGLTNSPQALSMVQVLLKRGVDINKRSSDGVSPVHVAAAWGNYGVLSLLLRHGADAGVHDAEGCTPLDVAVREGRTSCALLLRAHTANSVASSDNDNGGGESAFAPQSFGSPLLDVVEATCERSAAVSQLNRSFVDAPSDQLSDDVSVASGTRSAGRFAEYFDRRTARLERVRLRCCGVACGSRHRSPPYSPSATAESVVDLESSTATSSAAVDGAAVAQCMQLSDATLRRRLTERGFDVGPITPPTRLLYARRLAGQLHSIPTHATQFSAELSSALKGRADTAAAQHDETMMIRSFLESENSDKQWREGRRKMSFCYLLLDPAWSRNLPQRVQDGDAHDDEESFRQFIESIFYIGKGKKSRPYEHLKEAAELLDETTDLTDRPKTRRIVRVWQRGDGVVSVHLFQNTMPVEAFTREALMISAIGLANLTNARAGDVYGAPAEWPPSRRRRLGAWLLRRAMRLFLLEGERQLRPRDVVA